MIAGRLRLARYFAGTQMTEPEALALCQFIIWFVRHDATPRYMDGGSVQGIGSSMKGVLY